MATSLCRSQCVDSVYVPGLVPVETAFLGRWSTLAVIIPCSIVEFQVELHLGYIVNYSKTCRVTANWKVS